LLVFSFPGQGQSWRTAPYEIYAGFGSANYFGDIGGTPDENNLYGIKDFNIARSRPGVVTGLRYYPGKLMAFSGSLTLGWLSGNDKGWKNDSRGYAFNTVIVEPLARIEFFPLRDIQVGRGVNRRGMVRNYSSVSAYFFGGVGAVLFHVMPNEQLSARQDRDGIDHGSLSMVLPAGLGVKVGVNNSTDIGFEFGGRYALNDYLDGFTSDTSTSNDIYYITSVNLVIRLARLRAE
jgi:hypothetical protein